MTGFWLVLGRLALAALLGGLVGIERESLNRPAGFRTHILVCVGAALVMMVSLDVFNMFRQVSDADPGRIAAQVVTGVGFLGAGTILREGATVRGLTTAASLWVIAAGGLAVGAGLYPAALATAAISLITLVLLARLEPLLMRTRYDTLRVVIADRPGQIGKVGTVLGGMEVNIKDIRVREYADDRLELTLFVRLPMGLAKGELLDRLRGIEGVSEVAGAL